MSIKLESSTKWPVNALGDEPSPPDSSGPGATDGSWVDGLIEKRLEGAGFLPEAVVSVDARGRAGSLLAQAIEDRNRGRTTLAQNGEVLAAYAGEDDKARRWDGDWTNIPYPPFDHNDRLGMAQYLCQRVLDLVDPDNPTLTYSQKAELLATVNTWEDGRRINFGEVVERYLAKGFLTEADFTGYLGGGNANPFADGSVFEGIRKVAEKITQLEKQADLPNADMRDSNALMNDLGLYATTRPDEEAQERRPSVWSGSNLMDMTNDALSTLIGFGRPA